MKENIKRIFSGCLTVPNLLSVIRIILIPIFGVLFYHGHLLASVIVLGISGLTDLFDGKIARKFNQVSELGKMLDPIADKLTQMTIAVILFLEFHKSTDHTIKAFSWVFLFFIAKELFMVVVGGVMVAKGLRPSAAVMWGKVATCAFYGVMILILAFGPDVGALREICHFTLPNPVMMVLVVVSALLTLAALLSYVPNTVEQFGIKKQKAAQSGQKEEK